jgi:hypothetical protein
MWPPPAIGVQVLCAGGAFLQPFTGKNQVAGFTRTAFPILSRQKTVFPPPPVAVNFPP